MLFFFFKQKTAYEMRISDWSSDVCSSDLEHQRRAEVDRGQQRRWWQMVEVGDRRVVEAVRFIGIGFGLLRGRPFFLVLERGNQRRQHRRHRHAAEQRSEEHTSELQSLMRISYAVFCLKKTKDKTPTHK